MSQNAGGAYDEVMFNSNPNFYMKQMISEGSAECIGGSCDFEVYQSPKDQLIYLFIAEKVTHNINMISLPDNKTIKTLEGHKNIILNLRYFSDKNKENEYLVSADINGVVIIWDIKNFTLFKSFQLDYKHFIYSCLLLIKENINYLITSSIDDSAQTKVFNFKDDKKNSEGKVIPEFEISGNSVFYLMYWYNSKNNGDYVIQCGNNKVNVSNLLKSENYADFPTDNQSPNNFGGVVYTKETDNSKEDFLMVTSSQGSVKIFNLFSKANIKTIQIKDAHLYNALRWSEKYIIILNSVDKTLEIIDLNTSELISEFYCPDFDNDERYIKKIEHPLYGECLISLSPKNYLKLWSSRDVSLM